MSISLNKVKSAVVAELARQVPNIYFWDPADEELFDGGPIKTLEFIDDGQVVALVNKFDMDKVAAAVLAALAAE